jgi:hypothetical protein
MNMIYEKSNFTLATHTLKKLGSQQWGSAWSKCGGSFIVTPHFSSTKRQRQWRNNFNNKVFTFNNNGAIRWNLTPLAAFLPSLKSMSCSFPRPLLSDKKIHLNSHLKMELNASLQRAIENLFKKLNAKI